MPEPHIPVYSQTGSNHNVPTKTKTQETPPSITTEASHFTKDTINTPSYAAAATVRGHSWRSRLARGRWGWRRARRSERQGSRRVMGVRLPGDVVVGVVVVAAAVVVVAAAS